MKNCTVAIQRIRRFRLLEGRDGAGTITELCAQFAEREPGRGVAGHEVERLHQQVGSAWQIAFGLAVTRPLEASVGNQIPGRQVNRLQLQCLTSVAGAGDFRAYLYRARVVASLWGEGDWCMSDGTVSKVLGGSPLGVLVRLVLVSILVGVILSAFGLDPFDIVRSIQRVIRTLWDLGFDAFRWLWRYFLLGAVIVIPVWILMRLFNAPRGR